MKLITYDQVKSVKSKFSTSPKGSGKVKLPTTFTERDLTKTPKK